MEEVLQLLPLAAEMNEALLNHEGPLGEVLDSVLQFEAGNVSVDAAVGFDTVAEAYEQSLRWLSASGQAQ